jgi:hypothetical protein
VDESIVQDATALRFNVLSHMIVLRDLTLGSGWVTYLDLSNPALSFATGLKLLDLRARSIVDFDVAPQTTVFHEHFQAITTVFINLSTLGLTIAWEASPKKMVSLTHLLYASTTVSYTNHA